MSIDLASKAPTGEYNLVAIYESGRLPVVKLSKGLTSEEAIRICTQIFREYGLPMELKSDNGPAFKSQEFKDFLKRMGVHHRKITPLNPEANGNCERFLEESDRGDGQRVQGDAAFFNGGGPGDVYVRKRRFWENPIIQKDAR